MNDQEFRQALDGLSSKIEGQLEIMEDHLSDRIETLERLQIKSTKSVKKDNQAILLILGAMAVAVASVSWEVRLEWFNISANPDGMIQVIDKLQAVGVLSFLGLGSARAWQAYKAKE